MKYTRLIIYIYLFFLISACSKETNYYGKILSQDELSNISIFNKDELLRKFGNPSYIDPIENKYFYYSEVSEKINIFNSKTNYSYLFVFKLDENNKILEKKVYDLLNADEIAIIEEETENEVVKRGLIQKIFGGVGNARLPTN
tara:strand:- start:111 stop:539 length:429 start_codon:yes stop_codon:yes gene_type:complete